MAGLPDAGLPAVTRLVGADAGLRNGGLLAVTRLAGLLAGLGGGLPAVTRLAGLLAGLGGGSPALTRLAGLARLLAGSAGVALVVTARLLGLPIARAYSQSSSAPGLVANSAAARYWNWPCTIT